MASWQDIPLLIHPVHSKARSYQSTDHQIQQVLWTWKAFVPSKLVSQGQWSLGMRSVLAIPLSNLNKYIFRKINTSGVNPVAMITATTASYSSFVACSMPQGSRRKSGSRKVARKPLGDWGKTGKWSQLAFFLIPHSSIQGPGIYPMIDHFWLCT